MLGVAGSCSDVTIKSAWTFFYFGFFFCTQRTVKPLSNTSAILTQLTTAHPRPPTHKTIPQSQAHKVIAATHSTTQFFAFLFLFLFCIWMYWISVKHFLRWIHIHLVTTCSTAVWCVGGRLEGRGHEWLCVWVRVRVRVRVSVHGSEWRVRTCNVVLNWRVFKNYYCNVVLSGVFVKTTASR